MLARGRADRENLATPLVRIEAVVDPSQSAVQALLWNMHPAQKRPTGGAVHAIGFDEQRQL